MEKTPAFSSGLYHTTIKPIESYVVVNQKFNDPKVFVHWHDRLGHPGSSMMRRIIEHSHGHPLKNQKILSPNEYSCAACSQEWFSRILHQTSPIIARPLLMKTKLPTSAWGHAIMHAAALVRIRPTTYHEYSPSQLVLGKQPNISHLRIFGCAVYVPIAPTQRTKMGPQRRLGVYVGFDSPSIIRYLEPLTGDVFTARFADCHFNESVFPSLGREKSIPEERREISWKTSTMTHLDPRTNQCELEVQRIIHLQNLANQLPDAFIDTKKVTKSHIPAANTPARIDVPVGQLTNESKIRLKRGRPVGSKDVTPRKRRTQEKLSTLEEAIKMTDQFKIDKSIALEEAQIMQKAPEEVHIEQEVPEEAHIEQETSEDPHIEREAPEEAQVPENCEISVSYVQTGEKWDRNNIVINNIFAFQVAFDIIRNDEDPEPRNVEECRHRNDWPKWKEAIQAELNSLTKREVFGPVVQTPEDVKPVGYKWVFVRKRNENNEIIRYKARLVAQGFSQRPGVDYEETYSPVMDAITFRFLISLAVSEGLDMRLMDPRSMYSIKLQRSLYGLKQSGRMWYNRLSEYLLKEGYVNNPICPCIFIKKSETGFAIIAVYVDDLNLVGTPEELTRTTNYLKKEFEMKDLGKTKFCLGLQIEHFPNGVLVHQSTYIKKVLKRFYMDKTHPLSSPMVVRSLDVKKDPFRPCEKDEELLGPEVPYLSAIGALMYLANCTRPDIAFSVNLLARYSSSPTRKHWNGIKHILRYLRGTTDMGLFYSRESKQQLLGYADAGYLSDPHKGRSQTGYVFNYNGTAISWRSVKQTMVATSSNHSEILAIHEASRECIWLRSMIQHIRESCGLSSIKGDPTTLFEDNAACIAQITGGYIKGDRTKHISPKFFYTHELQKSGEIDVQQIRSSDNLADLFTKSLPTSTFKKLIHRIGMRQLKDIDMRGSMLVKGC
ncbi:Copia protein [Vitis vinifera]|uniref:Copia protein n=1 Tax=Vitis vinifera TaxID=29760 RepID=A0A438J4B8_VITVI|nr:Copia protein [Vitis vinifera]